MGKSLKSLKKNQDKTKKTKTTNHLPLKPARAATAPQRVIASQTEAQLFPFPEKSTPSLIERLMDPLPMAWEIALRTMDSETLSTSFLLLDNPLEKTIGRIGIDILPENESQLKRPLHYQSTLSIIESLHHRAFKGAIFEFSNS